MHFMSTHERVGRFPVLLYPGEDGQVVAECPVIPGCVSQGRSRDEAIANIRLAMLLCLENREAEGWTLPGEFELLNVELAEARSTNSPDRTRFAHAERTGGRRPRGARTRGRREDQLGRQ
jgi:predicted RNase H-like HicB family nuclease